MLAEDHEEEILLTRRAFRLANIINPLRVVRDGDEAISYLKGDGPYAKRSEYPLPSLLLLDLRMPRVSGFEVLEWIRQQPGLAALPVVVLTVSQDVRDIQKAYELGAASFLVKPVEFNQLVELIKAVHGYWLSLSKPPKLFRPDEVPDLLVPASRRAAEELIPPAEKMNVLLKNLGTNLYYGGKGLWVADPQFALDFQRVGDAVVAFRREKMSRVEVVMRTEQPACELRVPVPQE